MIQLLSSSISTSAFNGIPQPHVIFSKQMQGAHRETISMYLVRSDKQVKTNPEQDERISIGKKDNETEETEDYQPFKKCLKLMKTKIITKQARTQKLVSCSPDNKLQSIQQIRNNVKPQAEEETIALEKEELQVEQLDSQSSQQNQPELKVEKEAPPPQKSLESYYGPEGLPYQKFSPVLRRKLIVYMNRVCYEYRTSRAAFALACHILDEFLLKTKRTLPYEEYNVLTITCLNLAIKFQGQNYQHKFDFPERVTMKMVVEAQKEILFLLQFQLHKETYNSWTDELIKRWDSFVKSDHTLDPSLLFYQDRNNPELSLAKITSLYDKLDCIYTISYSKQFEIRDICLNLLYLTIFIKTERVIENLGWRHRIPQIIFTAYGSQRHVQLFENFLRFAGKHYEAHQNMGRLNMRAGLYLGPFLKLIRSQGLWYQRERPEGWNWTQLRRNERIESYGEAILTKMMAVNRIMI